MRVEFDGKTFEFEKNIQVKGLLKELQINPESVLVVRGDELLTEDLQLNPSDEVRIIRVISGG